MDTKRKLINYTAVSYTHLDVYKRQGFNPPRVVHSPTTATIRIHGEVSYNGK